MNFVVDRSKWLRGTGEGFLLDYDSKRCCIGFCGAQLSLSDKTMIGIGGVADCISHHQESEAAWFNAGFSTGEKDSLATAEWVNEAYSINDDSLISDATRESQLKGLFSANGHTIEFVDKMEGVKPCT